MLGARYVDQKIYTRFPRAVIQPLCVWSFYRGGMDSFVKKAIDLCIACDHKRSYPLPVLLNCCVTYIDLHRCLLCAPNIY